MLDPEQYGLRRLGFAVAVALYEAKFNTLPVTPEDLKKVTNSIITQKKLDEYLAWFKRVNGRQDSASN